MTNTALARLWFDRVWEQEDASAIDQLFDPSGRAHGLDGEKELGPEDFKGFQSAMLSLIGNIKIEIIHSFENGNQFMAICRLKANAKSDDRPIVIKGSVYMDCANDKICYAENYWDFISFFEQLNLLPENTIGYCLHGKAIGQLL